MTNKERIVFIRLIAANTNATNSKSTWPRVTVIRVTVWEHIAFLVMLLLMVGIASMYLDSSVFAYDQNPITGQTSVPSAAPEKLDPRTVILDQYLAQRRSPLAGEAEFILGLPNWRLVLAIAFAEGNYCRHHLFYNCWGIGGQPQTMRRYADFREGLADADRVIQKYVDAGAVTPKQIMRRWVGWHNPRWTIAVEQSLADFRGLGLSDTHSVEIAEK